MAKVSVVDIGDEIVFAVYQDRLVKFYKMAFGESPWNEVFETREVQVWFKEMMDCPGKIILGIFLEQKLVGATFCVDFELNHDAWGFLPTQIKKEEVIYLAESFIDPAYQGMGLGAILHDARLRIARSRGYKYALQRTSEQSGMYSLICKTGFTEIGRQMVVSLKFIKGVIKEYSDERIISLKKL